MSEYIPVGNSLHTRSFEAVPGVLAYVPALHVVHVVHVSRFAEAVYVPSGQPLHVQSFVVLPAEATYVPALHVVIGTHAVAALAS